MVYFDVGIAFTVYVPEADKLYIAKKIPSQLHTNDIINDIRVIRRLNSSFGRGVGCCAYKTFHVQFFRCTIGVGVEV